MRAHLPVTVLAALIATGYALETPAQDAVAELAVHLAATSKIAEYKNGQHKKWTMIETSREENGVVLVEEYEYDGAQFAVHRLQRKEFACALHDLDAASVTVYEERWLTDESHYAVGVRGIDGQQRIGYRSVDTWTIEGKKTEDTYTGKVAAFVAGYFSERADAERAARLLKRALTRRSDGVDET